MLKTMLLVGTAGCGLLNLSARRAQFWGSHRSERVLGKLLDYLQKNLGRSENKGLGGFAAPD